MPISQQRMIALINAAIDYAQAFDRACLYVHEAQRRVTAIDSDPRAELANLALLLSQTLLRDPGSSKATIAVEQKHFQQNRRRNEKAAERKRHQRGLPAAAIPYPSVYGTAPRPQPGFIEAPGRDQQVRAPQPEMPAPDPDFTPGADPFSGGAAAPAEEVGELDEEAKALIASMGFRGPPSQGSDG